MAFPTIPLYADSMSMGIPGQLIGLNAPTVATKRATGQIDFGTPLFAAVGDNELVAGTYTADDVFIGVAAFEEKPLGHYEAMESINCVTRGQMYVLATTAVSANNPVYVRKATGLFVADAETASTVDAAIKVDAVYLASASAGAIVPIQIR